MEKKFSFAVNEHYESDATYQPLSCYILLSGSTDDLISLVYYVAHFTPTY